MLVTSTCFHICCNFLSPFPGSGTGRSFPLSYKALSGSGGSPLMSTTPDTGNWKRWDMDWNANVCNQARLQNAQNERHSSSLWLWIQTNVGHSRQNMEKTEVTPSKGSFLQVTVVSRHILIPQYFLSMPSYCIFSLTNVSLVQGMEHYGATRATKQS